MSIFRPKTSATALALALPQEIDKEEEKSLKHLSDDFITNRIFTINSDAETMKIDIDSYILFIESVIKSSDKIAVASHWVRFHLSPSPFSIFSIDLTFRNGLKYHFGICIFNKLFQKKKKRYNVPLANCSTNVQKYIHTVFFSFFYYYLIKFDKT